MRHRHRCECLDAFAAAAGGAAVQYRRYVVICFPTLFVHQGFLVLPSFPCIPPVFRFQAAAGGYSTILRLLLSSRDEKEKEKSLQEAVRSHAATMQRQYCVVLGGWGVGGLDVVQHTGLWQGKGVWTRRESNRERASRPISRLCRANSLHPHTQSANNDNRAAAERMLRPYLRVRVPRQTVAAILET